ARPDNPLRRAAAHRGGTRGEGEITRHGEVPGCISRPHPEVVERAGRQPAQGLRVRRHASRVEGGRSAIGGRGAVVHLRVASLVRGPPYRRGGGRHVGRRHGRDRRVHDRDRDRGGGRAHTGLVRGDGGQ